MVKFIITTVMLITLFLIFIYDLSYSSNINNNGDDGGASEDEHNNAGFKRAKRTVGGSEAPTGAFPYQISLRTAADNDHFCSGSILRPMVVLTAAHCVFRKKQSELIVVAGSNKLSTGGTKHNVLIIEPHEDFVEKEFKNDLALLILYPPLFYSDVIKPIDLDVTHIGDGVNVTLSGWGKTNFNGGNPDKLQFLNLTTMGVQECRNRSRHKDCVTKSTICTPTKIGEGACMSDSGGPLVANGRQIGIVSWGDQCAIGYPDIYTRVSSFMPWIRKKIDHFAPVKFRC